MRVLLTTESFLPYLSGVTVSVDSLARGLGAAGHDVLVLAPRPARGSAPAAVGSPGPEPRYAWLPSYQLPLVAPAGYRMPWPLTTGAALAEARAFAPEVVHAHAPFVSGLLARRLARYANVPLVFTHHTRFADYGHYLGPLAAPGARLVDAYLRRFWAGCRAVIAPSTDLAGEIQARLGPGRHRPRVHVVPTGVDVDGIRGLAAVDSRPAAGWEPAATVVASLGRLAPEKSPTVLLEAFAAAVARAPGLRLLVMGGGPSLADLERRAGASDLVGRVVLTGALPRPAALARLKGADLFAFTSRTETQGLVLAEALATGLPTIAVDGPGVRDSIRDGIDGRIVDGADDAERARRLADALVALAVDGERRAAMAARAIADADRFALASRVAETERVYRSAPGATRP